LADFNIAAKLSLAMHVSLFASLSVDVRVALFELLTIGSVAW
jgi:hypothetical protein